MIQRRDRFPTETFLQLLNLFQPSAIRYCRRVFTNRNLRMSKVQSVGFDMDYTLAIYKHDFDLLAWDLALHRLVEKHRMPEDVVKFNYDPTFAIRGLIIDMRNGNIFKMDSHRHVSTVFHGTRPVPVEQRNQMYRKKVIRMSNPSLSLVDTLFSLPETHMFAQTVDLLEAKKRASSRQYHEAYRCIRDVMDEIHNDGSLKQKVLGSIGDYVERDPDIARTLERFVYSGKKLFLLTNSGWTYTNAVMSYLLDGQLESFPRWTDYFQMIVVQAEKPGFFARKTPLVREPLAPEDVAHKAYRGGSIRGLEQLLAGLGDRVLYIGDHIYGDMLRSKKATTWRTCMIVPEMEAELDVLDASREELRKFDLLFERRSNMEVELNYQQRLFLSLLNLEGLAKDNGGGHDDPIRRLTHISEHNVGEIREALDRLEGELQGTQEGVSRRFNPRWGSLFKEHTGLSIFGEQVEDYACVYSGRVTNFLSYSPLHYFRTGRHLLPHDRSD